MIDKIKNLKIKYTAPNSKTKVCPKCTSELDWVNDHFTNWLLPEEFHCKKCGYKGSIYFEKQDNKK